MDSKDKKQLAKQRRDAAKQAQKYHKEQEKQNKKSSAKAVKSSSSKSKIKEAVNERRAKRRSERRNMTREEKYRREGEEKLRNLQPHDFEGGYYIDEFSEKQRQEKRAQEIRKQENEVIHRNKKPLTSKQIRKRRILISAGIFAAVIIIGAILSLTVLFKTEKIDIEGDVYYDDEQIIAFSNVALQQNIFLGGYQRDNPHGGQPGALFHGIMIRKRGNRQIRNFIYRGKQPPVYLKKSLRIGNKKHLAFGRPLVMGSRHRDHACHAKRTVILMDLPYGIIPDIEMPLSDIQEMFDIPGFDNGVSFKGHSLETVPDFGNVMAEPHADGLLHSHLFH